MPDWIDQFRVLEGRIEIELDCQRMAAHFGLQRKPAAPAALVLSSAVRLTRTGRAVRLVHGNGALAAPPQPEISLVALIGKARKWWAIIATGDTDPSTLAAQEGVTVQWLLRVMRLAFLSPAVTEAALAGTLAAGIDCTSLLAIDAIAHDWQEQATLLAG